MRAPTLPTMPSKKPLVCGLGPIVGPQFKPRLFTRRGAQQWGDRRAAKMRPKGFWHAVICDCNDYYRVSFGAF